MEVVLPGGYSTTSPSYVSQALAYPIRASCEFVQPMFRVLSWGNNAYGLTLSRERNADCGLSE